MILSCPSCEARFRVRHEMFRDGPRKVKCARCGHRWMGEPETEEAPAPEPIPPAIEEPEAGLPEGEPEVVHPVEPPIIDEPARKRDLADLPPLSPEARAMGAPYAEGRTPGWVWFGWAMLLLLVVATGLALVFMRGPLVAAWPPLERLYGVSDTLMSEKVQADTQFRVLNSALERSNGTIRMKLQLQSENASGRMVEEPVVAVDLIDGAGSVISTVHVRVDALAAGESRTEQLILDDVPSRLERVRASASTAKAGE